MGNKKMNRSEKLRQGNTPINLMRSPHRILNHLDLIQKKVWIGEKYGLVLSDQTPTDVVETNLQKVADLLAHACSFEECCTSILDTLDSVGLHYEVDEFERDLWEALRVGLLEYHITDCCDLACPHCFYGSTGEGASISLSEFSKLKLLEPKAMVITGGGEPTIYCNGKHKFAEAIEEIRTNVPGVQLGLQTNGTVVPKGSWSANFVYTRSSVDADNAQTFVDIKSKPFFEKVVANLVTFANTSIPFIGIGFLFEKQNIDQIPSFIRKFHALIKVEAPAALQNFTIQFRPLGPDINILNGVRDGHTAYPPGATAEQIDNLKQDIALMRAENPELADFMDNNTNLDSVFLGNSGHEMVDFKRCYVSLAYRMIRASGNNFPCFILVQHERMCLGNFFGKDPKGDKDAYLSIALCGYHFFNCRTEYCNACYCRQSTVNQIAEMGISGRTAMPQGEMARIYFF